MPGGSSTLSLNDSFTGESTPPGARAGFSDVWYNTVRVVAPLAGGKERDEEEGLQLAAGTVVVARLGSVARAGDRRS